MESISWKRLVLIAGITLVSACNSTAPSQTANKPAEPSVALFQMQPKLDKPALQVLQAHQGIHPYLTTLFNDPATLEVHPVTVNPNLITTGTEVFSVTLPDGKTARFQKKGASPENDGMVSWYGDVASDRKQRYPSSAEVDFDPFNWVSIVRNGDQLIGSIHVDGQLYRLEAIGASQHVLVKVDESKLPPVGIPESVTGGSRPSTDVSKAPTNPGSTIRLLFVTTNESRAKNPNLRQVLTQALTEANLVFSNSQTNINFELAGFHDANYSDSNKTAVEQLNDLRTEGKALWTEVIKSREESRSDVVVMYPSHLEYSGYTRLKATKDFAYALVLYPTALAHELGHILGVGHGYPEGEGNIPRYAYGYRSTSPKFHTRMISPNGSIPFFSNPRLRYENTPIGTAEYNDASRQLNDRREVVENFYPDPRSHSIRAWVTGTNNKHCYIPLIRGNDDGTMLIIQSREECKDNKIVGKSVEIADWQGVGKLCFANLLKTLMICYSGRLNGEDFKINDLQTGAGKPDALTFTKRGVGEIHLISFD